MKYNTVQGQLDFSLLPLDLQKKLELLENQAQEQISKFTISLINALQYKTGILEDELNQSDLTFQEKEQAKMLFKQTILEPLEEISLNLQHYPSEPVQKKYLALYY